jgi:hypothetical protein
MFSGLFLMNRPVFGSLLRALGMGKLVTSSKLAAEVDQRRMVPLAQMGTRGMVMTTQGC